MFEERIVRLHNKLLATRVAALVCLTLCAIFPAASLLWAQSGRGTIVGSVLDSSGATVPDVRIQIVNTDTNSTYDLQTNEQGLFTAPNLPVGTYKIVATKSGFGVVQRQPVSVDAEVQIRVDFTLQPGTVEQSVTVEAEAPLLDVSTTGNATGLKAEFVHDLPVTLFAERRSVTQYLYFVPGLTGGLTSNNDTMWTAKMNGSMQGQTEVFIDGARATEQGIQRGAIEETGPTVEAVGEFTTVANAFNAEYGGFGAWFTQITIKSGTNDFHGSLYDHFQNSSLNARTFFQPFVPPLKQNEGGGTIGGPIDIPKLYSGKNKAFFFLNQGIFIAHQGAGSALITVPTPAFKQGDFSQLVNAAGAQIPIYDPNTTVPDGKGGFTRTPFVGNVIPQSRITPQARAILPYMSDPTLPGITNNAYSHAPGNQYRLFDIYNTTAKVDYNLSDRQKLSLTYSYGNRYRDIEQYGYVAAPAEYHLLQLVTTHSARLNYDFIISPTLLNHFTVAYDRYKNLGPDSSQGGNWDQKLGITGIPDNVSGAFPAVSFSGGTASPINMGRAYNERWGEQHFTFSESLTWNHSKHEFKFGAFYGTDSQNENQRGGDQGNFAFSNAQTSQPLNASLGNAFASFLLGAPNTASALFPTTAGMRYRRYALFAQDSWRITNSLTLSYGLRYDYDSPGYEINNHLSTFSPTTPNPGAGGSPGGLVFASGSGYAHSFVNPWRDGFAPRLGVAYQMNKKTVLRASGGLYYATMLETGSSTAGFNVNATFTSPDTFSPVYYWTQPFPNNFVVPPVKDPSFLNGQAINYLDPQGGRLPQIVSWTVGIQRQLARDLSLDVAYIGSRSTHLSGFAPVNVVPLQDLSLGSLLAQQVGSAAANAAGIFSPFPGFLNLPTHTVGQALKPYPQFTTVNFATALNPSGVATFNSLQIKATKRFSHGFQFLAFYTRQKTLSSSDVQPQNILMNRFQAMSVSPSDIPNTLQISANYTLPFGKGHALFGSSSALANRFVSGWELTTSLRYQSGLPLTLAGTGSLSGLGYSQTANYISGNPFAVTDPRNFDPSRDRYLNAAAFQNPAAFAFGNTAPTLSWLRGFTQKYESISINKTTAISERVRLEIGMDVMNPFNFVRWGNPNTSITSANFGQVTYVQGQSSSSGALNAARTLQLNAVLKF